MKKDELNDIFSKLGLEHHLGLEDIPNIDLYMDQVIQLFENKFSETRRNDGEKVLTKTMINNYAKGKLFFPIHNKKYSKEHLLILSLIYQLKGALSIQDIKDTLAGINKRVMEENFNLHAFYNSYLNLYKKNIEDFKNDLLKYEDEASGEAAGLEGNADGQLEKILLIASLANISSFYKRAAEKLVDELSEQKGTGERS